MHDLHAYSQLPTTTIPKRYQYFGHPQMNTKLNEGPEYYQRGNIEVWDFIRDQSLNYHLGNVIKYICRAGYKDNDLKDLKKAAHYLLNEIENRTKLDS